MGGGGEKREGRFFSNREGGREVPTWKKETAPSYRQREGGGVEKSPFPARHGRWSEKKGEGERYNEDLLSMAQEKRKEESSVLNP